VLRGDGNVRVSTLAEYLYELGFEAKLELVNAGELRQAAMEGRPASAVQEGHAVFEISVSSPSQYWGMAAASQSTRPLEAPKIGISMAVTFDRGPNIFESTGSNLVVA
jgi:hypothetical protein